MLQITDMVDLMTGYFLVGAADTYNLQSGKTDTSYLADWLYTDQKRSE